jgi:P-type Ca2+ transporter type 2C
VTTHRHVWDLEVSEVAADLGTDLEQGLTAPEAARRLEAHGPNELVDLTRPSVWRLVGRQFANTMTVVLGIAAIVSFVVGDATDTIVIAVIVVANAVIGFVQEYRAEQAMEALKRRASTTARVEREGRVQELTAASVVPGDVVDLVTGDIVPADLRLAEVHGLRVNEASLTGESEPASKSSRALGHREEPLVAERHNMAFKGTAVTYGRATGIAVATGMETELGQIAALLQSRSPGPTPLQRRLAVLGRWLAAAALTVCAVVFVVGILTGESASDMFLTSVSLAVAAIPEGLPAVVTIALALGARRMAERHAVIRHLPAVETLGSVSVICADKTGTLTQDRMMVVRMWTPAATYRVGGFGYRPEGDVSSQPGSLEEDPYLTRLARVAAACGDAALLAPVEPGEDWSITGDPTEGALVALAGKLGVDRTELLEERPRVAEIAFDEGRRRMTTAHRSAEGQWLAVKGAFDALVPLASPDGDIVARAREAADGFAGDGYRVLALAERVVPDGRSPIEQLESDLQLLGVVAIEDPPRPEDAAALASCRDAGVRSVMITGDHPRTARAIATQIGLLEDDGLVMTGRELDRLGDEELVAVVPSVRVFARTNPEQKLRIVEAWKAAGAVVAMTGDGVNDAPALRLADIGVAMGRTGTDVSREAADMVLTDDNFATIVHAVEEGRRIYDNIRRFVRYLLTTNTAEVAVMLVAPLLGLPLPLIAIQILWINLVTDGLPAIALGMEPAEPDVMRRAPRPRAEGVLSAGLWQSALVIGAVMAGATVAVQSAALAADWPWRTMVFTTLAFLQLANALAMRSEHQFVLRIPVRTNLWLFGAVALSAIAQLAVVYLPALQRVFETESLDARQLGVVVVVSLVAMLVVELDKWRGRRCVSPTTR